MVLLVQNIPRNLSSSDVTGELPWLWDFVRKMLLFAAGNKHHISRSNQIGEEENPTGLIQNLIQVLQPAISPAKSHA